MNISKTKPSISRSNSCSDSHSSYNSGSHSDMSEESDHQEIIEKRLSSLEKLCKKQGEEILRLKESNNFLVKKVESLERTINNIIKAARVKDNIQAEILATDEKQKKGKGNKDKEIKKELPVKKIKKIKPVWLINDLTNDKVLSMAEIQDKRLTVGCEDGSLSICSCNLKQKIGKEIFMKKKHILQYRYFVV